MHGASVFAAQMLGIVSLELEGEREEIKNAIEWLEESGIKVEPVEINTIEG